MSFKYFIDWKSNHVLKMTNNLKISEYRAYDTCYNLQKYSFIIPKKYISYVSSFLIESVDEKCIYSTGSKVCYFDGNILQLSLKELYYMKKLNDNIYYHENTFLIVDENVLYLLKLHQLKEFQEEIVSYYPLSELVFSYASNCIKLYEWRSLYDKICKIQIDGDVATCWMNIKMEHVLLTHIVKDLVL